MTQQALVVMRPEMKLAELEDIEARLAKIENLDEAKDLRNRMEAIRVYLVNSRAELAVINRAVLGKLLIDRRAGELLARIDREQGNRDGMKSELCSVMERSSIARSTAHRLQVLATIPTNDLYDRRDKATAAGEMLTTNTILVELAREQRIERNSQIQHRTPPGLAGERFRVIYADPPWQYDDERIFPSGGYGKAVTHYPTMSIDEIANLAIDGTPVCEYAADDAVLFLWVTAPKMYECGGVAAAWGFDYKTHIVWDKVDHNFGHYVSARHELLLIATRGSCLPDRLTPMIDSVQTIGRSEIHSAKPPTFRDLICQLYDGPRLELFARESDERFVAWGNQVPEPIEAWL